MIQHYLQTYLPFIACGFVGCLLFFFLRKYFFMICGEIGKIFSDTLKLRGSYTRTSLTMFSSFFIASAYALYDLIKTGFKMEVFLTYMAVATGIKLTDALSKKMTGRTFKDEKEAVKLEEGIAPPIPEEKVIEKESL